jgi:hypothetical protein
MIKRDIVGRFAQAGGISKKGVICRFSDSEDEDNMIGLVEWVKGKKIVSRPFGKKEPENIQL